MNIVNAFGSNRKKRKLAEDVANFCVQEMMPRMKTLEVGIILSKGLEADGYCLARNKREFEIEIDANLEGDDFISCVCHEMVHVKQQARGELKDINLLMKKWKNEDYVAIYSTVDEYMALPWEAEAYELQESLCTAYNLLESKG